MNLVGPRKRKSVRLTWFASIHSQPLSFPFVKKIMRLRQQGNIVPKQGSFESLQTRPGTNGWYLRVIQMMTGLLWGAMSCEECRIDSIAQSFLLHCVEVTREKPTSRSQMRSRYLYDRENRVVKLFSPPFSSGKRSPGYIKGYSPGFRGKTEVNTPTAPYGLHGSHDAGFRGGRWEILNALLPK
jgi:cyclic beta-1,2-glucan synthetase